MLTVAFPPLFATTFSLSVRLQSYYDIMARPSSQSGRLLRRGRGSARSRRCRRILQRGLYTYKQTVAMGERRQWKVAKDYQTPFKNAAQVRGEPEAGRNLNAKPTRRIACSSHTGCQLQKAMSWQRVIFGELRRYRTAVLLCNPIRLRKVAMTSYGATRHRLHE